MMESTTSPPAETEPRFLVWGGLFPQAPEEFKERFDFLLYKCIRQRRGGDAPIYTLEATLIFKDEQGNACTDRTKHGKPYPPLRQLIGPPQVKLASWVEFEPDHHAYYRQVKTIFGEWYHKYRLPLPKCENEKSNLPTKSQILTSSRLLHEYVGWRFATHSLKEAWAIIQQEANEEEITLSISNFDSLKSTIHRHGVKKADYQKKYHDVKTFEDFLEKNRYLIESELCLREK